MKLRENNLRELDRRVFDALVVGGGINGAVSAAALSGQGAQVALIDKGDFASFTSQQSSNLVWGGIKYLESFEFALVRKLCKSRNHLIRSYPSTVREVRFFTTLEQGFRRSRFTLFLGTLLYWLMGSFFDEPPRLLSRGDIGREEPVVDTGRSPGGMEYSDAYLIDHDARFVFNFVRNALNHGAIAANYVESMGAQFVPGPDGGVWQVRARDGLTGREFTIRTRVLINACGPYVDQHNERTHEQTSHRHVFSKGIHLIVDRVTPSRRVLTFFADDGRLFFVIPMGNKSCIGTTDTRVDALPAVVTPEDRRFVLENINKRLRLEQPLTERNIIAERCGVRPLAVAVGKAGGSVDWMAMSRKHVVEVDARTRHLSIFGGKLTDCLNVGEEICGFVRGLGVTLPYPEARWYGEPPAQVRDDFFHQARLMRLDERTSPESSEPLSTRLWRRYGAAALALLEDIRQDPSMAEVLIEGTEYIRCELYQAARREMITKLEDFLRRRSKIALVARHEHIAHAPGLREACRILFGDQADAKYAEYFAAGPRFAPTQALATGDAA